MHEPVGSRSETIGYPYLSGRCVNIRVDGAEVVELVIENLAADGDIVGHAVLVAAADEPAVIVADSIGVGPGIATGAVDHALPKNATAAPLGAEHFLVRGRGA